MVFAPDDGTIRGHVSHILIMTLLIWLLQDITKVRLNTTLVDQFFFIFHSSPLRWFICHVFYLISLLSLLTFYSVQFILLEPLSLISMVVLYNLDQ